VFRIGISLADVISDGDDLYGDGVNLAARLEALAEPGGICVSDMVQQAVRNNLDVTFDDLGPHQVKNIARPVRVHRVRPFADNADGAAAPDRAGPAAPDRPSIAILAFDNMSGDPEQEYFSDGISEDLITAVSRLPSALVIARNSTFGYKGRSVDVKQVGRELGARYVLEGSVRRAGDRVRITAQLIDAATGHHLWAERFDREIGDIFAVQDEITAAIVEAVLPELELSERERARRKPPDSLSAWEAYQRGLWLRFRFSAGENVESKAYLRQAIALDPEMAQAHSALAESHYADVVNGYTDAVAETLATAEDLARQALAIDDRDFMGHYVLGRIFSYRFQHEAAREALETALRLNPNFPLSHVGYAIVMGQLRRPDAAFAALDTAMRLGPRDPAIWIALLCRAATVAGFVGDIPLAVDLAQRAARHPVGARSHLPEIALAGYLMLAGDRAGARAAARRALAKKPDLHWASTIGSFVVGEDDAAVERMRAAYRAAGLPE
jgi:adenylate cyclase